MSNRIRHLITIVAVTLTAICFGASAGIPVNPAIAQTGWYAEYFANASLSGAPALTRYDDTLHFEWGTGSPGSGIPDDNFSARWTHDEWFETGTYRFSYRSDDGIRIWVGDTLVVDDWRDRQANWAFVERHISRGTHPVRVEYFEHTGGASVHVTWEQAGSGEVWRGEYFDDDDLSGSPMMIRYDPAIDFDWGEGSPDETIAINRFSVRWTRTLGFTPGTYRFYASCDDGVRIYVDGNRVVDAWEDQKLPNTRSGDTTLSNGQHTIVVEYYEHSGGAHAHVWWDRLDSVSGWEGKYYANTELRGGPALVRDDAEINFDWGEGAPADWMPADNFSVLWTRDVYFAPGYYRLNVQSDDGVRVWLDGRIIMDFWQPMDYEWHYVEGVYLEGTYALKVEYFEGAGGARIHFWWDQDGAAPPPSVPAPAPAPVPTPAPSLPGPWNGEYFNSPDLSGSPALVRTESGVDFNWGWGSPASEVNRDNFSARWSGDFHFESGSYRFTTTTDDGVRLYVDDRLVIEAWRPMRGSRAGYATLAAGSHTVRVEYFERNQAAMARVSWQRIGAAPAPTPMPAPTTPDDQGASGPWKASYYDNENLSGNPVLTRQDAALDFNWGWGSPGSAVPSNNFAAVWTRAVEFGGGRYTFTTTSDDGVRLYVDEQLVIDSWRPMRGNRSATLNLSEETHTVRLEYFERSGVALVKLAWRRW
jgi:hypothetical protein